MLSRTADAPVSAASDVIELDRLPGADAARGRLRFARCAARAASICCAATVPRPGAFTALRRCGPPSAIANRGVAMRATLRRSGATRRSSPITFRAGRCFRQRCCSMRRSNLACNARPRSAGDATARCRSRCARRTSRCARSSLPGADDWSSAPSLRRRPTASSRSMLAGEDGRPDRGERASRARARHGRTGTRMTRRAASRSPASASSRPSATTSRRRGTRCSTGRSGGAPITLFDASGFPTRIAAEVKGFDDDVLITDRKLLKFTQSLASLRARRGRTGDARRGHRARPTPMRERWGCAVGTGHDGRRLRRPRGSRSAIRAADGELDPQRLLTDAEAANDPLVFCRSQATGGLALLTRRFGIRGYATSVHTACASGGQAIGTALKLIRRGAVDRALAGGFDSMISPIGLAGFCLLSARVDRQRRARAREPAVRRDAQRLPARRGRGLRRARGMGSGAAARRAHLRRARRRRQLAVVSYRITDSPPDGDGPIQAMRAALADAGADARRHRLHQRARHVDRR